MCNQKVQPGDEVIKENHDRLNAVRARGREAIRIADMQYRRMNIRGMEAYLLVLDRCHSDTQNQIHRMEAKAEGNVEEDEVAKVEMERLLAQRTLLTDKINEWKARLLVEQTALEELTNAGNNM